MIAVFTGNGKGKTTAALGNALRVLGAGKRALMVQFIKGPWKSGEHTSVERLAPDFTILRSGKGFVGILGDTLPLEEHKRAAHEGLRVAHEAIDAGTHELLILDEVNNALKLGLITLPEVLDLVSQAEGKIEHLILTGRDAPQELIDRADLVTEMREIKHPYQTGRFAEKGLDF